MTVMSSVKLQEIMATSRGSVDPSKSPSEVFDLYSIPAFDRGEPEVVPGSAIGSTKQVVQPNDVLLSKIVPHIRRAWVVGQKQGRRMIASSEWIVFRNKRFHPSYLRHLLTCNRFHAEFMATVSGVGGSLLRARPSNVAKIAIPLPPLPEQKRVAAILDQADAIRRKRQQAHQTTNSLIPAAFYELFGDPGMNPRNWPVVEMGEVVAESQYGTSSALDTDKRSFPILRMNNITYSGDLDLTDLKWLDFTENERPKYTVRKGDLLFNRTNSPELVGKTAVWPFDEAYGFAGYLIRMRFNETRAISGFVSAYLNSSYGKALLLKSAVPSNNMSNISASAFRRLPLMLPPLKLQRHFVEFATQVRSCADRQQHASNGADSLFQSLVQRAFRGEL